MNKRHKPASYYSLLSFFSYMKEYRWRFGVVMLSFAIADLALAIIPLFIGRLVGALAATPMQGHSGVVNVWVLVILSSTHNLMWRTSEYLYMKLINPLGYRYENILFNQIINKPYPYFVDKFTGKLSSYVNTISQEMRDFFSNLTYNYTNEFVSLVTITLILSSINWQTGVIFIIGLVAMLAVGRHTIKNSSRYEKISADVQSTKNAKIIDAIANFVNVKSFQKESAETTSIEHEQEATIKAANKSYAWTLWFWASISFFVRDAIWPATIGYNVYLFFHHQISLGQLTTVLSTVLLFTTTVWEVIWYVSQFNLKLARIEEAHTYLFGKINIIRDRVSVEQHSTLTDFSKDIELRKLSFAYPDKQSTIVLHEIDLRVRKGEKLGIVGHSGSGKTTLSKLLLGYYPIASGQLLLDGREISSRDSAALISYVPQDTSLFHRSIAKNISYAADHAVTQQQIETAAKRAHAHEFIAQIDDTYNALVGERGVKLSAGQRQRIAIARAFLDDKPILILDEATSALDSESEVLVQEALEELWEEKTVIAIAHRLSTLRHMDRILVMDDGRIVEQGSHTELLKKNGIYAKLWGHQSGGFIDD